LKLGIDLNKEEFEMIADGLVLLTATKGITTAKLFGKFMLYAIENDLLD